MSQSTDETTLPGEHAGDPSGATLGPRVLLLRHGETEWSRTGRHTGRTDIPLTARGEEQARAAGKTLPALLRGADPAAVLVSPLQRARRTAELAGLVDLEPVDDLMEWDYGDVEGITTQAFRQDHPGWTVWDSGPPGGESIEALGQRVDRALERVRAALDPRRPVVVVAHGHLLRVLAARWLGLGTTGGQLLRLDPATWSVLGFEHDRPALLQWNAPGY
ncbi:MAG: histidine phosphatase family protein [Motilibacteraceae bacterium]|jgi:probable phosphoglycerate mutase|nr:histidine phosphatase family protein [Motilibacteraceae bacterium]